MKIIDNYRQLKMCDYLEIQALANDDKLDALDYQVQVLSILTNSSESDILNLPIGEYKALVAASSFLEKPIEDIHTRLAKSYIVGGFELIPTTDYRKVTAAQYIDYQTFSKAGVDQYPCEIVSCFLVPKGKHYADGYDVAEVQKAIREEMSVAEVMELLAFFFVWLLASTNNILISSRKLLKGLKGSNRKKAERMMQELSEAFKTAGGGLQM